MIHPPLKRAPCCSHLLLAGDGEDGPHCLSARDPALPHHTDIGNHPQPVFPLLNFPFTSKDFSHSLPCPSLRPQISSVTHCWVQDTAFFCMEIILQTSPHTCFASGQQPPGKSAVSACSPGPERIAQPIWLQKDDRIYRKSSLNSFWSCSKACSKSGESPPH